MCFLSPKSSNTSTQATTETNDARECNLNSSGNTGTSVVTGGSASLTSNSKSCSFTSTVNNARTNDCNITINNTSCGCVARQAIDCSTALAGGSIRTIACLAKSLVLDLECSENSANARLTCLTSCLTRADQTFASKNICAIARLACADNQAVACLAARNQASNNTLLAAVAGTLGSISQAQDTSQASQSTAFATSALKIAAVVVLGLGAVAVIYAMSKRA